MAVRYTETPKTPRQTVSNGEGFARSSNSSYGQYGRFSAILTNHTPFSLQTFIYKHPKLYSSSIFSLHPTSSGSATATLSFF